MQLISSAFHPNTRIPEQYTCKGADQSPPLLFSDVPPNTQSFAIIMHDPDAPAGDWVHWTIWNIPSVTRELLADVVPQDAVQGVTSANTNGYHGPCPPPGTGTHRYIFELYALDAPLDLPATTTRDTLLTSLKSHTIAKAELIGLATADS